MNGKRVVLALVSNILIIVCVSCLISYCFFKKSDDQQKQQLENIAQLESQLKALEEKEQLNEDEILDLAEQIGVLRQSIIFLNSSLEGQQAQINTLEEKVTLLEAKVKNLMGKEPKYTEEAPRYTESESMIEYISFDDKSVSFDEFAKYCKNNFTDYNVLLLSHEESEDDDHPLMYRSYSVFAERIEDGIPKDITIFEYLSIYTDVLGRPSPYLAGEGGPSISLSLKIYIKPTAKKMVMRDISLEFGNEGGRYGKYINFYYGIKCFATCFYETDGVFVSDVWFHDFFRNYLIYA